MSYYFIGATRFHEPEEMMKYLKPIMPLAVAHGGEFVVQGLCDAVLEGDFPISTAAIIKFPDRQAALGWYESKQCQELKAFRSARSVSNALLAAPMDTSAAAQPAVQPGGENRYYLSVTKIHDAGRMQTYVTRVEPLIREFGGDIVVRLRCETQLEGSLPADNVVAIRFASADAAHRWYQSPQYTALRESRAGVATSTSWLIRRPAA